MVASTAMLSVAVLVVMAAQDKMAAQGSAIPIAHPVLVATMALGVLLPTMALVAVAITAAAVAPAPCLPTPQMADLRGGASVVEGAITLGAVATRAPAVATQVALLVAPMAAPEVVVGPLISAAILLTALVGTQVTAM